MKLLVSNGINVTRVFENYYKTTTNLETYSYLCRVYPELLNIPTLSESTGWILRCRDLEILDFFCTKTQLDRDKIARSQFLGGLLSHKNWPALMFILGRFQYTVAEFRNETNTLDFRKIFIHGNLDMIRYLVETMSYRPSETDLHEYLGMLFASGCCESFRYMMGYFGVNDDDFRPYHSYEIVRKADIEFLEYFKTKRITNPTRVNLATRHIDKFVRVSSLEKIQYVLDNDIYFYKHREAYYEFCLQAGRHARPDVFRHIRHVLANTSRAGDFKEHLRRFLKGLITEGHSELFYQFVIEYNIDDAHLNFRLGEILEHGSLDLVKYAFSRLRIGPKEIRQTGYALLACAIQGNNAKAVEHMLSFREIDKKKVVKTIIKTSYFAVCDIFTYDVLSRKLGI